MKASTSLLLNAIWIFQASSVLGFSSTTSVSTAPTSNVESTNELPAEPDLVPKKSYKGDLDCEKLLAQSTFPIKPDSLIDMAKTTMIEKGMGIYDDGECLADNFQFRAQFVEVNKEEMLQALGSFNLEDSFDMTQQFFGWTVDPLQTNRVWFYNRQLATHVKDFAGVKPDGKKLVLPPQNFHMDFDEAGKVSEFGFYTVDRALGNTGGLGGAFGFFYGVGRPLPFPEAKPYKKSVRRRALEFIGKLASKLKKKKE